MADFRAKLLARALHWHRMGSEHNISLSHTEVRPGIWLDSRLALWLAAERILVVADLHWGYAASHRARGNLLPLWGDQDVNARLTSLIADYDPTEMIWLGDIVHAAEGAVSAEDYLRRTVVPTTVLAGNHDRRWHRAMEKTARRGKYFFHHGDIDHPVADGLIEIVGHHHPAFHWWDGAGGRAKLPALVSESSRLVLPAFSPWAAGTEWKTEPGSTLWVIAGKRLFPVTTAAPVPAAS